MRSHHVIGITAATLCCATPGQRDGRAWNRRPHRITKTGGLAAIVLATLFVDTGAHAEEPIRGVTVMAKPAEHAGTCPATIRFTAAIDATVAVDVELRWTRSDGAQAAPEIVRLVPGINRVETAWTLGGPGLPRFEGWQAVEILAPQALASNQATFKVECRDGPETTSIQFRVDPALVPAIPDVDTEDGRERRPVAVLVGPGGTRTEFVADELLVLEPRDAVFERFLRRWNGVVADVLPTDRLPGLPPLHRVKIAPTRVQAERIEADFRSLGARGGGEIRVSSAQGLATIAAAAAELARRGYRAALNPIVQPTDFLRRESIENAGGPPGWSWNAWDWPYMSRRATDPASVQDIGVADAWRAMQLASPNRLLNRIPIAVVDSGFQRVTDLAPYLEIEDPLDDSGRPWRAAASRYLCGSTPSCPFHGLGVALTAAAIADNHQGVAGPAGPVANLIAVRRGAPDSFYGIVNAVVNTVVGSFAAPIVNMSFSGQIDSIPSLVVIPVIDPILALARASGHLIFAAAGNCGSATGGCGASDIDALGDLGEEGTYVFPCESPGVFCVAGLALNARTRDPSSSFGSRFGMQGDSVDLFGPFTVWSGDDPTDFSRVTMRSGTSVATPFVAGVAGLVMAANPSLGIDATDLLLRRTANLGLPGEAPAWVNAFAAVTTALGGAPPDNFPPAIEILSPSRALADTGRPVGFLAAASDLEGRASVTWRFPDGTTAFGPSAQHIFTTEGTAEVIATATDEAGATALQRVTLVLVNPPPAPEIRLPIQGQRVLAGTAPLNGYADDRNEGPGPGTGQLTGAALTWRSEPPEVVATGTDAVVALTPGPKRIFLDAVDNGGGHDTTYVDIMVVTSPDEADRVVQIVRPTPGTRLEGPLADVRVPLRALGNYAEPVTYVWTATWEEAGTRHDAEIARGTLDATWAPAMTGFGDTGGAFRPVTLRVQATTRDGPLGPPATVGIMIGNSPG